MMEVCSVCNKPAEILWRDTIDNKDYCMECSVDRAEQLEKQREVSK